MKKFLALALVSLTLAACGKSDKDLCLDALREHANDPDSIQIRSMEPMADIGMYQTQAAAVNAVIAGHAKTLKEAHKAVIEGLVDRAPIRVVYNMDVTGKNKFGGTVRNLGQCTIHKTGKVDVVL